MDPKELSKITVYHFSFNGDATRCKCVYGDATRCKHKRYRECMKHLHYTRQFLFACTYKFGEICT